MATKQQIEEVSKEANAVIAASRTDPDAFAKDGSLRTRTSYLPSEQPGPTVADLKAAIRELAGIARSRAPMMQSDRIVELLALAD